MIFIHYPTSHKIDRQDNQGVDILTIQNVGYTLWLDVIKGAFIKLDPHDIYVI